MKTVAMMKLALALMVVLIAVAALMTVVHTWGALQRIQPISETLEIGMYAGLGVLAVLFYPG